MAAALAGEPIAVTWSGGASPAGQSISVPADCTAVYMYVAFWTSVNNTSIASATLAGRAPSQLTGLPTNGDRSATFVVAWYNPPTGQQLLVPRWSSAPAEGPTCIIVFVRDGDTTSWRDAGSAHNVATTPVSVTLATEPGDLVLKFDQKYGGIPPLSSGWTSGQTHANNSEGARLSYIVATGASQLCDAEDEYYTSLVAVSIGPGGGATEEGGEIEEGAELGAEFSAAALVAVSISESIAAGDAYSGRASALASITESLEAGDTDGAAVAAAEVLQAQVSSSAQYDAIAQAAAAIQAGLEAGEDWAAIAAAEAGLIAGVSLGSAFVFEAQSAQEAALEAGTEAAAQFLGAVAAFGLLSAGVSASDAFGASARIGQAFTAGAQLGASFAVASANDVTLAAAAFVQAAFAAEMRGAGRLAESVDVTDAYQGISVALAAISAGVTLGAVFSAASSADVSIVGATASVRAIRRMSASVRSIRPTATIN